MSADPTTTHDGSVSPNGTRPASAIDSSAGGERLLVHNPATGERVGSLPLTGKKDVSGIVQRAREAQEHWATSPLEARERLLRRYHDLVLSRMDLILDTIQGESGKARRDALTEVASIAGTARYYAVHGAKHLRERAVNPAVPLLTNARVRRLPWGVAGMITPWNYPFLVGSGDWLPALLAGNAVVSKPSELTPMSAALSRELLIEAGLDENLVQLVYGPGEIGTELIKHVDHLSFTGSSATGKLVAAAAAKRMLPVSLELGGKNAMLVLEGANVRSAVSGLVSGAFHNSGQTCISIERIYVVDSLYDEFVQLAAEQARATRLGWSSGWDMDMGSLISVDQADKVESHVAGALEHGASAVAGGARRRDLGDAFFEPTVLVDVTSRMKVCSEETFGPVISVFRVADTEEAIARANDSQYGLNASVWARSQREGRAVARQLRAGSVGVNATLLIYNTFDAPMGGMGSSGVGRRHGSYGVLRYTQDQSIVGSFARWGGYEGIPRLVTSDRRASALKALLRAWRHVPGMR